MNHPIRCRSWLAVLVTLLILTLPQGLIAAPPNGGGGGGKISVTAANPSEAFQGEELDVTVTGSGFDTGSTVSYLVTGTTDASQVEVLSVQVISSTELKTRIRPKDAALPAEYDIEVRTLSGRKGKGTTLFRVKLQSSTCVADPDATFPAYAYMTMNSSEKLFSIYLSSSDGCEQTAVIDNQSLGNSGFEVGVDQVRLSFSGERGVVIWSQVLVYPEPYNEQYRLWGITLERVQGVLEIGEPTLLWNTQVGEYILYPDVHFSESNGISIVYYHATSPEFLDRDISYRAGIPFEDLQAGGSLEQLPNAPCLLTDNFGNCLSLQQFQPAISVDGSKIYFSMLPPETDGTPNSYVFGEIELNLGKLENPKVILDNTTSVDSRGVSGGGEFLAYRYHVKEQRGKNIKTIATEIRLLPLSNCGPEICSLDDGTAIWTLTNQIGSPVLWLTPSSLIWPGETFSQGGIAELRVGNLGSTAEPVIHRLRVESGSGLMSWDVN